MEADIGARRSKPDIGNDCVADKPALARSAHTDVNGPFLPFVEIDDAVGRLPRS